MKSRESDIEVMERIRSMEKWNGEPVRELVLFKPFLGALGIWPPDTDNVSSKIRWVVALTVEFFTAISLSMEVQSNCYGIEEALDAFMLDASAMVGIAKLLLDRFKSKYKLRLMESICEDWSIKRPHCHHEIMENYAKLARIVYTCMLYLGYACIVAYIMMAVPIDFLLPSTLKRQNQLNVTRRLIIPNHCIWGETTFSIYSIVIIMQILQLVVDCLNQTGNDGLFFLFSMHLCGQFNTLKTDFTGLKTNKSNNGKQLGILIKRHRRLVKLASTLEQAYNLNILSQLFMSVVLLCVEGFQFVICLNQQQYLRATKHILFIIVLLSQVFLYSFAGQSLEYESQGLAYAVYDCSWYEFNVKTMKDLGLIMLRGEIPHQVTAGKFLAMNFVSFKEILKASASYMSLLRVMVDA